MSALAGFHPIIERWFRDQVGQPTDAQEQSWQRVSAGEHVLITAPTGSGKTFAAFLWAINQLITGEFAVGHTSVLYVSPLKALNNDIQRNLLGPMAELRQAFEREDEDFPDIHVRTRSGDTPQAERFRMQRHPPEILITTPESLNLMLSSAGGRSMLHGIATVILDEVHAVIGSKRGTYLATAVERLVPLSGEFQRIALSATMRPLETVAAYIGGFRVTGAAESARRHARPVAIVRSAETKRYDVRVRFPEEADELGVEDSIWDPLADEFRDLIGSSKSTLLFANSRRLCEKLALKINRGEEPPLAYVHHGSLSRELRYEVERKLRDGDLRAVVATNSLELGIDIGALERVILVQSPPSISSAIQRVGRAGHRVGEVCRGTIYPTHAQDLLEAVVLAHGIGEQDLEETRPVECPLDVLAQVIVSMTGVEQWDIDALYTQLTTSYPYHTLDREQFNLVLNMLGGRYADSRLRDLKPMVSIDRVDNSVVARKGALLTLYTSGGVIPDRGYYHLRHSDDGALIGELDEEFVWEANVGQTFALGTQNWRVERITHNDVFVQPGNPRIMATPFWRAEENYRDSHLSERIGEFLEDANEKLGDDGFTAELQSNDGMEPTAAEQLVAFLKRQRETTGRDLPHRHHVLVEYVATGPGGAPGNQVIIHTTWGGRINRPLAMALDAAWEEKFGQRLELYTGNDCIAVMLPDDVPAEEMLSLVTSGNIERLLRRRLEGSGFFGARFRECAGRALLLPRDRAGKRMPLWMNRLRSQKLLDAVIGYEDFPILLEAWRSCLQDEFDMEALKGRLAELESGAISWSEARTAFPSPMAHTISWRHTVEYMYMDDQPAGEKISRLRSDLLTQVVFTPGLRPSVSPETVAGFEEKRQRLAVGYAPETPRELVDWVKERVLISMSEWWRLLDAIGRDHDVDVDELVEAASERLAKIAPREADEPLMVAIEMLPRLLSGLYDAAVAVEPMKLGGKLEIPPLASEDGDRLLTELVGEWLAFFGPISPDTIRRKLGIGPERLAPTIDDLLDSQRVIAGQLVTGEDGDQVCDSENFEALLRISRAGAAPALEPLEAAALPLFLANHQGLVDPDEGVDGVFRRLEQLLCLPVSAEMWESEVLPIRLRGYSTSLLDTIMQEGDLRWVGSENRRVAFCFEPDLDLVADASIDSEGVDDDVASGKTEGETDHVFPSRLGRYDFMTLVGTSGDSPDELSGKLWQAAWRGEVSNDAFAALRRGIENRFKVPKVVTEAGRSYRRRYGPSRASFSQWKGSLPSAGNWFLLPYPEPPEELIEIEERNKDRARLLLDRYGILFRQLLERESPAFRWPVIFRALRLMELAGEVLTGYFFRGVSGPQFISHTAFRRLQRRLPERAIYWMNATDPASVCGLPLEAFRRQLPRRVAGNHIVYRGSEPVVLSQRNGRSLTFAIADDDPDLSACLGFLNHLLTRQFQPQRRITVETINGEEAAGSAYVDVLRTVFDVMVDYKNVILYRKAKQDIVYR